jgi:hypothetical protein
MGFKPKKAVFQTEFKPNHAIVVDKPCHAKDSYSLSGRILW